MRRDCETTWRGRSCHVVLPDNKKLVVAQRAWVKFTDAQCAAEGIMVVPGSGVPTVEGRCLLTLTQERVHFLEGLERELEHTSKFCEKDGTPCSDPSVRLRDG
jgi:Lysozyme inhibitor LprI